MGDEKLIIHMNQEFVKKYGELLQNYFIKDSLATKYMSAGDLYNHLYIDVREDGNYFGSEVPLQSTFNRKCGWTVNFVNDLLEDRIPTKPSLVNSFFVGKSFCEVEEPQGSEQTYWENLFIYAWVNVQDEKVEYTRAKYKEIKEAMDEFINDTLYDVYWYKGSLWANILWSIELFRLRVFCDTLKDNSLDFVQLLDWIDIFEYRVIPQVLENVAMDFCEEHCRINNYSENGKEKYLKEMKAAVLARDTYKYFISRISETSDFPYAERFGIKTTPKKNIFRSRKRMIPLLSQISDISTADDEKFFSDLAELLKHRTELFGNQFAMCKGIDKIIAERDEIRKRSYKSGGTYTESKFKIRLEEGDTRFIGCCMKMINEVTEEIDVTDTESIMANLIIFNLLKRELWHQSADELNHPLLEVQKNELEQQYVAYRKNVLNQIFNIYSKSKKSIFSLEVVDITDDLLAEMLMVGCSRLTEDEVEEISEKLFNQEPDANDVKRNEFINQTINSLDSENKTLYLMSKMGGMERISGYITEDELSETEKDYIKGMSEKLKEGIVKMHELLQNINK